MPSQWVLNIQPYVFRTGCYEIVADLFLAGSLSRYLPCVGVLLFQRSIVLTTFTRRYLAREICISTVDSMLQHLSFSNRMFAEKDADSRLSGWKYFSNGRRRQILNQGVPHPGHRAE